MWVVAMAMVVILGGTTVSEAQTAVTGKDSVEIHTALEGMQAAWNHHDMKLFVSYMTDDVEWVNVVGMWWRGKAQVYKAHDALHKTMFKDRELHAPQSTAMRRIAPGVVVVTSVVPADAYKTPDGQVTPANRNVLTEIFVHRNGRWLVAEGHNTVIVEEAQAHDPGR
jgi:uncharacterized protein (TIGR02246 family)